MPECTLIGLLPLLLTVFINLTAPFSKLSRCSHFINLGGLSKQTFHMLDACHPTNMGSKHRRNSKNQPGNIVHCPFTFHSRHKVVTQQMVKTTLYSLCHIPTPAPSLQCPAHRTSNNNNLRVWQRGLGASKTGQSITLWLEDGKSEESVL